jgi:hypothetical protein
MIDTKYQAVEYFTFLRKICTKEDCNCCVDKSCGVLFLENHAYSANADVIGRIKICDNLPIKDPIFWSYGRDGEINRPIRDKFMLNTKGYVERNSDIKQLFETGFPQNFDHYLNRVSEVNFYIRKQDILLAIEEKDLSQAKRNKMKLTIITDYDGVHFYIEPIKITKAMNMFFHFDLSYFVYPGTYQKLRIDLDSRCCVNLFFFSEVVFNGFQEYEIIRIKYGEKSPLVIEGKSAEKSEVFFAISQIC